MKSLIIVCASGKPISSNMKITFLFLKGCKISGPRSFNGSGLSAASSDLKQCSFGRKYHIGGEQMKFVADCFKKNESCLKLVEGSEMD